MQIRPKEAVETAENNSDLVILLKGWTRISDLLIFFNHTRQRNKAKLNKREIVAVFSLEKKEKCLIFKFVLMSI